MDLRGLARRTAITGAGALAMLGGVGGAGLLGQAHADDPPCVANGADACLVRADPPKAAPPHPPHIRVHCQPAGMAGQHCFLPWVP